MINYKITIGILLLTYGLIKLLIGVSTLYFNDDIKNKIMEMFPFMKYIYVDDDTISGKVMEYAFIVFGLYSLLHGLRYCKVLSKPIKNIVRAKETPYVFYLVIGLILTVFYGLVVYSDLKIPKKEDEINRYKFIGILGGFSFLAMIPLYILYDEISQYGLNVIYTNITCILSILIITFMIFTSIYMFKVHLK